MKFEVRKAKYGDAEEITKVRYAAWLTTYPNKKYRILTSDIHFNFKKQLRTERLEKQDRKNASPQPGVGVFVATHNNKIVGMCRALKHKRYNFLSALYVLPEYQGKGVGSLLWKKAYAFMGKQNNIFLTVAIYNERAIRFYTKLGFKDTGKRPVMKRGAMRNGAHIPIMKMKCSAT